MQVGKEAVLWKHGLMTLPDTVAISLSRVQVIATPFSLGCTLCVRLCPRARLWGGGGGNFP